MSDNYFAVVTGLMLAGPAPPQDLGIITHAFLDNLMIAHTFLVLLVPLTVALFFFSTSQSRRRPLFIFNVAAIIFSFVDGIMIDAYSVHTILSPTKPWSMMFNVVLSFVATWQSLFVDLILLVRLISVYPPKQIGWFLFSLVMAVPVLLKLTRVVNNIIFIVTMVEAAAQPNAPAVIQAMITTKPFLRIDWTAQMVDNTYASLAFLWKIHEHKRKRVNTNSFSTRATLAERLRTLSYIALSNFLVPTVFSIAQFVGLYHNINPMTLNQLIVVNTMLSTFGVTFATVWAGSINRQDAISTNKSVSIPMTHFSMSTRDRDDVK